jgi:hypothetical protein
MRITDTGTSKIENANTRESRVTSTTKKEPEFTGPAKYSPFVETLKAVNAPKVVDTPKAVVPVKQSTYSPGDFRKAEEKSNEPFYQQQQLIDTPVFSAGSFSLTVSPTPLTPTLPVTVSPPPPPVKTATLDIILFDEESIPTDGMFDQIFENIGGQELISITRSDIVNDKKYHTSQLKTFRPFSKGITQIIFLAYNKPQTNFLLDFQLN